MQKSKAAAKYIPNTLEGDGKDSNSVDEIKKQCREDFEKSKLVFEKLHGCYRVDEVYGRVQDHPPAQDAVGRPI